VGESHEQSLEVVLARLLDLAALEADEVEGDQLAFDQLVETDAAASVVSALLDERISWAISRQRALIDRRSRERRRRGVFPQRVLSADLP
jgi:hypothetical protein